MRDKPLAMARRVTRLSECKLCSNVNVPYCNQEYYDENKA
jgi:hypothetical protein